MVSYLQIEAIHSEQRERELELNLKGNPTGRSAKAPEKGTDQIPETE